MPGQFDLIEVLPHKEIGETSVRDLRLKSLKDGFKDLPVPKSQVPKFQKGGHAHFLLPKNGGGEWIRTNE